MSVVDILLPGAYEAWPVLDEEPTNGVTVWAEFEEDFLGRRAPFVFPSIPMPDAGVIVRAMNCPVTFECERERFALWSRRRMWKVRSSALWSEPEDGVCLTSGTLIDVPLARGDSLTILSYEIRT